jgi:bifunctional lysine-specific demethylase and histidyl-hydroxylase MINA
MTVCRYVDGQRDNFEPRNGKLVASKKQVASLLDKGYSCQFYQPQRHVDGLFAINAAFEEAFGCLAGASAYLTPPAAQALAPHHDNVEVFILQTQGRKKWKLYKPLVELAGEHSSDLSPDKIGDVWQEFTLEEGDVVRGSYAWCNMQGGFLDTDSCGTDSLVAVLSARRGPPSVHRRQRVLDTRHHLRLPAQLVG